MFRPLFKKIDDDPIDQLIAGVEDRMLSVLEESEEYEKLLTTLERLYKLKANERPMRVSGDTMAVVAGNLLGILIIVAYEQKHVMTSKGLNQIIRPKTPDGH